MILVFSNVRCKGKYLPKMAFLSARLGSNDVKSDDSEINNSRPMYTPDEIVSINDPPTTCCMSGCNNCVYIAWAEALTKQMAKADPAVAKKILENAEDPGMKAFLRMELRSRGFEI